MPSVDCDGMKSRGSQCFIQPKNLLISYSSRRRCGYMWRQRIITIFHSLWSKPGQN